MTDIRTTLIEFIKTTSGTDVDIGAATDLLTTNILDSLMLMELVLLIEHRWGVQLQGSDIAPSNFRTVANLVELVSQRSDCHRDPTSESCLT